LGAAEFGCFPAATLYAPVLMGLARQWLYDADAAYGWFVAAAAGVAVRQRWARLRQLPWHSTRTGAFALLVAITMYVVASLAADVFLVRFSLLVFVAAGVLFVCGPAHARVLAAPFALLLIAIPLPAVITAELTLTLQLMASRCAVTLLDLFDIPVLREGNVLTLRHVQLEVAQACSGMRSVITLFAVIGIYASLRPVPRRVVLLLVAAALPVALVANGVRIAFTGVLATRIGEAAVRGTIHEATGAAAFVLMCAALLGIHVATSKWSWQAGTT
jgi:exosortase